MELRRTLALAALLAVAGCGSESEPPAKAVVTPPVIEAPEPGPVVFMGDSITAGWVLPPEYVNAGASGQWSELMLARFINDALSLNPSVVHILAGTNDVRVYFDPSIDYVAAMAEMAAAAGACVIIGTIPPNVIWGVHPDVDAARGDINIANWNAALRSLAKDRGYYLADYHPALSLPDGSLDWTYSYDGIHPNSAGHARMLAVVEPLIDQCQGL